MAAVIVANWPRALLIIVPENKKAYDDCAASWWAQALDVMLYAGRQSIQCGCGRDRPLGRIIAGWPATPLTYSFAWLMLYSKIQSMVCSGSALPPMAADALALRIAS